MNTIRKWSTWKKGGHRESWIQREEDQKVFVRVFQEVTDNFYYETFPKMVSLSINEDLNILSDQLFDVPN